MDKIARICAEIEHLRREVDDHNYYLDNSEQALGYGLALDDIEKFLDTLSEEPNIPEFPETFEICLYDGRTPDNEKCTECSTTCSVRKEEPDKSLEEAAIDFADNARKQLFTKDYAISSIADYDHGCIDGFKAGWKCRDDQMPLPEDTVLFQKGVAEGRRLEMEDMLKDAVEGYIDKDHIVTEGPFYYIRSRNLDLPNGLKEGDKVRIAVLKEEE